MADLFLRTLSICLNGILMMPRFLCCRIDLILFQHAKIATIYIELKLKWNPRPLVECYA